MQKIGDCLKKNYITIFKVFMIWQILIQWLLAPVFPGLGKIGNIMIVVFAGATYWYNLKNGKNMYKNGVKLLPCLFLAAVLISIVFNFKINLIDNLETYAILVIEILLLIPLYTEQKSEINKDILFVVNGIAVIMFVCSFIGFILYMFNMPIYLYSNRFCGLFSNPNQSSVMAFWAICASSVALTFFKEKKKKVLLFFHVFNIIINFAMFTLSNSNTGKVMLGIMSVVCVFFILYSMLKTNKILPKIVLSIFVAILSGGLVYAAYNVTQNTLAYIPGIIERFSENPPVLNFDNTDKESKNTAEDRKEKPIEIEKKNFDRSQQEGGLNNNRFEIWREGFEAFKHSIWFGYGPRNVPDAVQRYIKNPRSEIIDGGLHNMYIELLVACGILGFITFFVFLISKAIPVLKMLFTYKFASKQEMIRFVILSASVVAFLGMNLTESTMLFSASAYSICFWVILGYVLSSVEVYKRKE